MRGRPLYVEATDLLSGRPAEHARRRPRRSTARFPRWPSRCTSYSWATRTWRCLGGTTSRARPWRTPRPAEPSRGVYVRKREAGQRRAHAATKKPCEFVAIDYLQPHRLLHGQDRRVETASVQRGNRPDGVLEVVGLVVAEARQEQDRRRRFRSKRRRHGAGGGRWCRLGRALARPVLADPSRCARHGARARLEDGAQRGFRVRVAVGAGVAVAVAVAASHVERPAPAPGGWAPSSHSDGRPEGGARNAATGQREQLRPGPDHGPGTALDAALATKKSSPIGMGSGAA